MEGAAAGLAGHGHGPRHRRGVSSQGNGAVDQQGVCAHFHGLGGLAGHADTGVYHHGHLGVFDDQGDVGGVADALARADRRAQGHHGGAASLFESLGQEWIGIDVGQHCEALLHQLLSGRQGAEWIGQQMTSVWNHLQLHEAVALLACQLGQLPSQAGHPDRLLGGGTAGRVGQHPDALPVDGLQQAYMAGSLALDPTAGWMIRSTVI